MATAQSLALMIVHALSPTTKDGQIINGSDVYLTVVNMIANGAGAIRVNVPGHGLSTGDKVTIAGTVGTTEANNTAGNPAWTITRYLADWFDLDDSNFVNAYISGGSAVPALVGAVDPARITKQRLLDIINSARSYLWTALSNEHGPVSKSGVIPGLVKTANITFASGIATKPTDFLEAITIRDTDDDIHTVLPSATEHFTEDENSVENPLVYEEADQFKAKSSTTTPDGTYTLTYFYLLDLTLIDIRTTTKQEQYPRWAFEILSEIAQKIALEAGAAEVSALANALVKGRKYATS